MKVLEFLNGKKTAIAAIISVLLNYCQREEFLDASQISLIMDLNSIFLGAALVHKGKKFYDNKQIKNK